ncbi:conjugative transposon protein TraM [Chryseobacterium mulctrae]|uniref:conjugative transposon protein TraM n=1 Tax=Chryseobacterium mulctrae TaxID=2576777 RepID=UPI0011164EDE|nr:conjugative transposon protein TraM [Chryseobacterium mulctrae]
MAINFQELLKDKKIKNAIVVCVALIATCIFLYFMFGSGDKNDERNDKVVMVGDDASRLNFEVPTNHDSILEGGTKIDAYDKKLSDSLNYAKQTTDALNLSNSSTSSSKTNENAGFSDAEFDQMRKKSLSNSSPTNSHSTYGNSSMWSNDVPSGSNIGYSELGNVITKPQASPKRKNSNTYQAAPPVEDNINFETQFNTPSQSVSTPNDRNVAKVGKSVRGKLISSGYASNGRSMSFVLLENFTIGSESVKKGQVITGTSMINDNRIVVNFNTIKVNGKVIPINARVVGYDGGNGLLVRGEPGSSNEAGNIIRDEAQSQASRIPVVGGIIGRATSGNSRKENKIQLSNNVECTIIFN